MIWLVCQSFHQNLLRSIESSYVVNEFFFFKTTPMSSILDIRIGIDGGGNFHCLMLTSRLKCNTYLAVSWSDFLIISR